MRTLVPFANPAWPLHAVKLALRQDGVDAEFVHMTRDDSYYDLMVGLWERGESFSIVEHDIVVHPGGIQELENCPHQWCLYPYYCSAGWIVDGLGCVKFGASLVAEHPNFFKEPFPSCCAHTRYYCGLDRLVSHRMQELGIAAHVHAPGVVNLNEKWT